MNTNCNALSKFLGFALLQITLLSGACQSLRGDMPIAEHGVIDLRNWDFETEGSVALKGQWAFYWQELLYSDRQSNASDLEPSTYFTYLPSDWKGYELNNQSLPGQGYASYHLKILLPKGIPEIGLNIHTAATAMAIYAQNKLIYQEGKTGKSKAEMQAAYQPDYVQFQTTTDTLNLGIEVSNFHYRKGGAWSPIMLGSASDIRRSWLMEVGRDFFLAGCLIIMMLYHLGFYLFRREEITHVIFGFCCFLIVVRVLCTGQYLITYVLPLSWPWIVRLEMLSFYLFVPLFLSLVYYLFPKIIPRWLMQLAGLKGMAIGIFVLLTPPLVFSYTIIPYEIITGMVSLFVLYKLFKYYDKNIPGQKILLIGLFTFFLAFINDVLYANNIISTGYVTSLGLLIFALAQSLLLSQRVSLAIQGLKDANQTLYSQNNTIHTQNEELTRLNKELDVFVYRTSHDLRAPLTSTLGLIEVLRMEEDPKRFETYLDLQEQALNRLDNFIQDILTYSRNSRLEIVKERIDFKSVLEEVFSLYQHLSNFELLEKKIMIDQLHDFYGDKKRLIIILNNLVSNAFRYYNPEQPQPYIEVSVTTSEEQAEIIVKDNGLGIAEQHLEKVFEMFYRASTTSKGSGLGLFIVKESVNKMNGNIHLYSKKGQGCKFVITLPNGKNSA